MATAMFHMKHAADGGERGSGRGLEGVKADPAGTRAPLWRTCANLVLGMLLAAAAPLSAQGEEPPPAPPAPPAVPAPPTPNPGKAQFTDNAAQGEARRDFAYSWPAEAAAIPQLAARFAAERDALLAEQKAEWEASLKDFAGEGCLACTTRSFEKSWAVVADLPRFLSLSASFYAYTGGAHGNGAFDALVWDREAKQAFDPKAMFRSEAGLQEALGAAWCKALKAERGKRLGAEYAVEDLGVFGCPPIADLTLLVGSSDAKAFDRIALIAAPYVAGSYAEGVYEATLPVTPAVLAAVRPRYKAAFAAGK